MPLVVSAICKIRGLNRGLSSGQTDDLQWTSKNKFDPFFGLGGMFWKRSPNLPVRSPLVAYNLTFSRLVDLLASHIMIRVLPKSGEKPSSSLQANRLF